MNLGPSLLSISNSRCAHTLGIPHLLIGQGRPFPPEGNLYPFQLFSGHKLLRELVQGGGTDEGASSMPLGSSSSLAMRLVWRAVTCSRTWMQTPWEGKGRDKTGPSSAGGLMGTQTWDLEQGGLCSSCLGTALDLKDHVLS